MMRTTLRTGCLLVLVLVSAALAGEDPTAEEQHGIYVINKARSNPTLYGQNIGVDLSDVPARPPLAVNRKLTASARVKCEEMAQHDYFAHVSEVTGLGPNQYIVDQGYDLFGQGLDHQWGTTNNTESLAWGFNTVETYRSAIKLLVIDEGVPSLGHRRHLLGIDDYYARMREIGCGRAETGLDRYYAVHLAYVSTSDRFLTGVVYVDENENGQFGLGEGIGGVTVRAGNHVTTTMSEGGWSLAVPNGTYDVICSGGGFEGTASSRVVMSGDNIAIDFRSGYPRGEVNFEWRDGPPASDEMRLLKAKVKVDYRKPGKDRIEIRGEIVLPEGFAEGDHQTAIRIGDVDYGFDLDVKAKTKDETGNRLRLNWARPKAGGGVGPGVAGKFKVKLKGDFAAELTSIGLTNTTETRQAVEIPVEFVLDGKVYPGSGLFRIDSVTDKRSKATLEK
jgi:hypothetical protein